MFKRVFQKGPREYRAAYLSNQLDNEPLFFSGSKNNTLQ